MKIFFVLNAYNNDFKIIGQKWSLFPQIKNFIYRRTILTDTAHSKSIGTGVGRRTTSVCAFRPIEAIQVNTHCLNYNQIFSLTLCNRFHFYHCLSWYKHHSGNQKSLKNHGQNDLLLLPFHNILVERFYFYLVWLTGNVTTLKIGKTEGSDD